MTDDAVPDVFLIAIVVAHILEAGLSHPSNIGPTLLWSRFPPFEPVSLRPENMLARMPGLRCRN
jgi:hypothetical protein